MKNKKSKTLTFSSVNAQFNSIIYHTEKGDFDDLIPEFKIVFCTQILESIQKLENRPVCFESAVSEIKKHLQVKSPELIKYTTSKKKLNAFLKAYSTN